MRSFIITAGLCLATTSVFAAPTDGVEKLSETRVTLANGCVYAPSSSGQTSQWTLVDKETGSSKVCKFQTMDHASFLQLANLDLNFFVGVFR